MGLCQSQHQDQLNTDKNKPYQLNPEKNLKMSIFCSINNLPISKIDQEDIMTIIMNQSEMEIQNYWKKIKKLEKNTHIDNQESKFLEQNQNTKLQSKQLQQNLIHTNQHQQTPPLPKQKQQLTEYEQGVPGQRKPTESQQDTMGGIKQTNGLSTNQGKDKKFRCQKQETKQLNIFRRQQEERRERINWTIKSSSIKY